MPTGLRGWGRWPHMTLLAGAAGVVIVALLFHAAHGGSAATEARFYRAAAGTVYVRIVRIPGTEKSVVESGKIDRPQGWLSTFNPSDGTMERWPIKNAPECPKQTSQAPQVTTDGRIVFVRRCVGNTGRPDSHFTEIDIVKPGSDSPRLWRPYYLPILTNSLAVAPNGQTGIIADGAANPRFHWLDRTRLSGAIPLHWAWAQSASFSPGSNEIAAVGIAMTTNRRGPDLLGLPSELAILDAKARIRKVLLPSVHEAYTPAWSPDGKTLAVSARPAGNPNGIYLINVKSGKARLLVKGRYYSELAWIAKDRIAAIYGAFERSGPPGIYVYRIAVSALP